MSTTQLLLERFITYLLEVRAYSDYTATSYYKDLEQYYHFLPSLGEGLIDDLVIEADTSTIVIYMSKLRELNYKQSSINRKIASLKSFYKWLVLEKKVSTNPVQRIQRAHSPSVKVRTVTREQLLAILAMPNTKKLLGARDQSILMMICEIGIKTEEIVHLDLSDLNLEDETPAIHVQGKSPRILNLGASTIVALRRYSEIRGPISNVDSQPLFVNKHGQRLSSRSIRRTLDKYLTMAKIDSTISTSTLRHTFALHLINQGVSPEEVAQQLGYVSGSQRPKVLFCTTQNILHQ